jgi:hypothetical protein
MYRLVLIVCLFLLGQHITAQHKKNKNWGFGGHLSIGLNIPIGTTNRMDTPDFLNIASETASNPGFELGGVAYYKQIGFKLGFGHYKYLLGVSEFQDETQKQYSDDSISTYMSDMVRDIPVFAGLSYRLKISNFCVEPEFLVRYNKTIGPYYADIYFWEENNLVRSINYKKETGSRIDLVPGIRLSYLYPITKKEKVGIQFSYHYSFSNPEIEYRKKEADLINRTVSEETEKMSLSYTTSNFSFGLVLRFN